MNITKIVTGFFNPRFSTTEIENSKLRCNLSFETIDMLFDDEKRGFPTHILGFVKTRQGHLLRVSWDRNGKCTANNTPMKSFDLIRPTQSQMDSGKSVLTSLVLFVIIITVCAIF